MTIRRIVRTLCAAGNFAKSKPTRPHFADESHRGTEEGLFQITMGIAGWALHHGWVAQNVDESNMSLAYLDRNQWHFISATQVARSASPSCLRPLMDSGARPSVDRWRITSHDTASLRPGCHGGWFCTRPLCLG